MGSGPPFFLVLALLEVLCMIVDLVDMAVHWRVFLCLGASVSAGAMIDQWFPKATWTSPLWAVLLIAGAITGLIWHISNDKKRS